jgi:N4-(beta-N-acetylglucosaminyl)-L-asparaginase
VDRRLFFAKLSGIAAAFGLGANSTNSQLTKQPAGKVKNSSTVGKERLILQKPFIVSTWDSGLTANAAGWEMLKQGRSALDAVEAAGCASEDEISCCVGLGAYPDRDGVVTLDASIMSGSGDCGSVAFLDRIKHPVSVARLVMERTPHILLAGEGARQFALENGFRLEDGKLSREAEREWLKWLEKSNYKPEKNIENRPPQPPGQQPSEQMMPGGQFNHDTMATAAMDASGRLAGMVTTSGLAFKMHGRVGDSPIIGAGLFVEDSVGAAISSGVGEEVIRICGTHTIIEQMRMGRSALKACQEAVSRIVSRNTAKARDFQVGFVAISVSGEVAAFAVNKGFTFAVTNKEYPQGKIFNAESYF